MSGPKTSHYTLTAEQRRILEEQRRIRIEKAIFSQYKGDARSVIADAERLMEQLYPIYKAVGEKSDMLTVVDDLKKKAAEALSRAASGSDKDGSAKLKDMNQSLKSAIRELSSAVKTMKTEHASKDQTLRKRIAKGMDVGFTLDFDQVGTKGSIRKSPIEEKIESSLNDLAGLFLADEQLIRMKEIREKLTLITDVNFLKNYYAATVAPFVKACQAYHTAYETNGEEYERKLLIYAENTERLGITAEKIPFSKDAINQLDEKICETEAAIACQEEQEYISKCLDEAMQEMGYTMAGNREVTRRSGKRFKNELYLFDEGTAVNVTYSSDGQITMELGGIDTEDRLPTAAESASLTSDMQSFCDDYYEIEKRLLKKGIVTRKISILPPEKQYAQIINVSDYTLTEEISGYRVKDAKRDMTKDKVRRLGE